MTERFRARVRDLQAVDVVALCILLVMVSSVALFAPARDAVADDGATGTGWTVLESTAERLRVRVEFAGESLALDPRTGHTVIRIAGAPAGGDPGLPSLPHTGRWLAVPPTGEATLRIDRLETEDLGVHRVVPTSTPRIDRDAPPGKPRLHEERIEGENYARFRTTAGDVVALDAPVFSRRQRMSALRVQPVIHDAATGRTSIVRTLEVTIEFPSSLARTQSTVSADETVGGVLLNPDVAARWTTLPPRLEAMRTETPLVRDATVQASLDASALVADPIRLRVNATDLYRVRAFSLVDEGELPETVRREQLRLVKLRPTEPGDPGFPAPDVIDVPLHFVGGPEPTEAVAVADQIIFYGLSVKDEWARWQQRPDEAAATRGRPDHYNNSNVYFLLAADPPVEGWARMTVAPAAPYDGSNPATEYQRVERFEQDGGYQEDPNNLSVERYHWNDGRDQGIAFGSVRAVAPIAGRELTVRFSAGRWRTESSSSQFNFALYDQNQNLQRNLGSQILASAEGGLVELERTASTDDLPDGGGPLLFGFSREDASSRVRGYFGYVELEYPASYRASGGRLRFGLPPTAGTYDVAVDGFSGGDLLLFDVTDAGAPRVLTLPDGSIADGEVRVRLEQAPP